MPGLSDEHVVTGASWEGGLVLDESGEGVEVERSVVGSCCLVEGNEVVEVEREAIVVGSEEGTFAQNIVVRVTAGCPNRKGYENAAQGRE